MKKENIKAVLEGMKGVTSESGGTAYSTFKDFDIEVGGKTGSATEGECRELYALLLCGRRATCGVCAEWRREYSGNGGADGTAGSEGLEQDV